MNAQEILNRALPKWPQMKVSGKPVTVEQAKEIIRRTDSLFAHGSGGNNHRFNVWAFNKVGYPHDEDNRIPDGPDRIKKLQALWDAQDDWRKRWGVVETSYVRNSWASSAFIHGPAGWCHPDGTISYIYNVGKWPIGEEVRQDWEEIARAFPFLELAVVLMSGEECEEGSQPVMAFEVRQGEVQVVDPLVADPLAKYSAPKSAMDMDTTVRNLLMNPNREQGLPNAWFEDWAVVVKR